MGKEYGGTTAGGAGIELNDSLQERQIGLEAGDDPLASGDDSVPVKSRKLKRGERAAKGNRKAKRGSRVL
jgi:hypothetical protein